LLQILPGERWVHSLVGELNTLEAWHQDVAPAENVGGFVDQVRTRHRRARGLGQQSSEKLLGRELPRVVRLASQDIVATGRHDEHVLTEQASGHWGRVDQATQSKPISTCWSWWSSISPSRSEYLTGVWSLPVSVQANPDRLLRHRKVRSMTAEDVFPRCAQFSDEELAYHEAGHAVLQVLLGGTVTRVSIEREDASRGVRLPGQIEPPATDAPSVHNRIVVLLGGEAALHVWRPSSSVRPDANDRQQAEPLAATISDQPASVLEADWQRAVTTLQSDENWARVKRVAKRLATERVLDDDEVHRLIRGS
jgi:hypothetical protein